MHEEHRMHEEQTFLWPIVAVLMVVILFCSVMLVRGTGEKRRQISVIVSDSSLGAAEGRADAGGEGQRH